MFRRSKSIFNLDGANASSEKRHRAGSEATRESEEEAEASCRRSMGRRALRRFSRFVHSSKGRSATIVMKPFAFMRTRGCDGYVTALRNGYRGHAYIQDLQGRYHQQLGEVTLNVPMFATLLLRREVLWYDSGRGGAESESESPFFGTHLRIYDYALNSLDHLLSGLSAVFFSEINEAPNPNAAYDALGMENHSRVVAYAYSKYASVDTCAGANTLDAWLQRPTSASDVCIVNACAYDLLLRLYKAPIEAQQRPDPTRKDHKSGRFKDLTMTYEGLYRFFHGEGPFDAANMGLSLLQFRTFFEHMALELTVVDITGGSVLDACFTPERANRKLNPRHVWVLHHDGHLFQLTSGLNALSHLPRSVLSVPLGALEEQRPPDARDDAPPSAHFPISRNDDAAATFIECLDDLSKLDFSGPQEVVRVACPVEMSVALYELVTRCSYLPGVRMRGGKLTSLKLRLHNKDVFVSPPDCAPSDRTVMIECREEFEVYHALDRALSRSLMPREGISTYSRDVGRCFRELLRSPLCFGTGADTSKFGGKFGARYSAAAECSVHDLSKAHTAALLDLQDFPVFTEFDRFKPFTGAVSPRALYIVSRAAPFALADPRFLLLDEEVSLVTARTVQLCQGWPGVRIESVLEPSKTVSARGAHAAIRDVWKSDLAVEHKKFLVNKAVGMLGRRYNTKDCTHLFRNEGEAAHFGRKLGAQLLARKIGGQTFYLVHKEERAELVDGFYPTQHFVYDWVRVQLYERALSVGRPLLAVRTDALYFAGLEAEVLKEHTFAGIGRWGVSCECGRLPTGAPVKRKSTLVPVATSVVPVTVVGVADEFDGAEMGALLAAHTRLLVLGDLPGVGKTRALKVHCPSEATLFVVPANKLKADIAREGHNAVTLHTLLGVRVDGEGVAPLDVSRYTTVVFDEVFAHAVDMLARIGCFMRKNATAGVEPRRFYAAGDPYQNPPIEQLCVSDPMAYYRDAVSTLFPTQLTLRVCKRVSSAAEQARLQDIKDALFTHRENPAAVLLKYAKHVTDLRDVQGTAICYLNSTVNAINHYLHDKAIVGRTDVVRVGGNAYFKGLELVCRKRLESYFADPSASGDFSRRGVLQVNFTYVVLEAGDAMLVLDDLEGGRTRIAHGQALAHFSYSHAFTGHAQQGMSAEGPITIFDCRESWQGSDGVRCGVNANWVYTALSRARNMQDVYVFVGELGKAVSEREFELAVQRKIYGHKAADKKARRTWVEEEYVTVEDVRNMLGRQRGCCAGCRRVLQQRWERGDHDQLSVDRKDNSRAHLRDNCQLLCLACNKSKQ